jgi:site-specific recombinase XerC
MNDLADTFIQYGNKFKETADGREETWENFLNRTGITEEVEKLNVPIHIMTLRHSFATQLFQISYTLVLGIEFLG